MCNNGTLSFSVFGLEIKRNTSNYSGSYLLYYELNDLQNETIHDYDADKRDYAMCLLKAASISPTFCPTDLLLIVWREYIYCESDVSYHKLCKIIQCYIIITLLWVYHRESQSRSPLNLLYCPILSKPMQYSCTMEPTSYVIVIHQW